jgi:protein-S-isoprenylcysteine O-methyltransferase Ste14
MKKGWDSALLADLKVWDIIPAVFFVGLAAEALLKGSGLSGLSYLSQLFLVSHMMLVGLLMVIRRAPSEVSWSPIDFVAAFAGTFAVVYFIPVESADKWALGFGAQAAGWLLSFYGMLSLNESMGIVPANRGVKTGGPYALVRHPIYSGYVLANSGYLMNNPGGYNAVVWSLVLLFTVVRIFGEERLLSRDREYGAYARRVRWRLIPGLW